MKTIPKHLFLPPRHQDTKTQRHKDTKTQKKKLINIYLCDLVSLW